MKVDVVCSYSLELEIWILRHGMGPEYTQMEAATIDLLASFSHHPEALNGATGDGTRGNARPRIWVQDRTAECRRSRILCRGSRDSERC